LLEEVNKKEKEKECLESRCVGEDFSLGGAREYRFGFGNDIEKFRQRRMDVEIQHGGQKRCDKDEQGIPHEIFQSFHFFWSIETSQLEEFEHAEEARG
jgi:hypothetical protein